MEDLLKNVFPTLFTAKEAKAVKEIGEKFIATNEDPMIKYMVNKVADFSLADSEKATLYFVKSTLPVGMYYNLYINLF